MGAVDFTMTHTNAEVWLKGLTPEQRTYFDSFPLWSRITWGVATWGSLLGSVSLLARRRLAYHHFLASFIAMVITTIYSFGLSDGLKVMGGGAGMIAFNATVFIISALLLVYARNMRMRGVLR